jgi:hypothetical protein
MDTITHLCIFLLSEVQIPAQLQVHPESRGVAKELCQPQGCIWGYTAPFMEQVIDALVGDVNRICQISLISRLEIKKSPVNPAIFLCPQGDVVYMSNVRMRG